MLWSKCSKKLIQRKKLLVGIALVLKLKLLILIFMKFLKNIYKFLFLLTFKHPVYVIIDVKPKEFGIPTEAYVSIVEKEDVIYFLIFIRKNLNQNQLLLISHQK
jgi:hypothetical protein